MSHWVRDGQDAKMQGQIVIRYARFGIMDADGDWICSCGSLICRTTGVRYGDVIACAQADDGTSEDGIRIASLPLRIVARDATGGWNDVERSRHRAMTIAGDGDDDPVPSDIGGRR